jgi:hypothetical protein
MPFPNRAGRPIKVVHTKIIEHLEQSRRLNPNYTISACARDLGLSRSTVVRVLRAAGKNLPTNPPAPVTTLEEPKPIRDMLVAWT